MRHLLSPPTTHESYRDIRAALDQPADPRLPSFGVWQLRADSQLLALGGEDGFWYLPRSGGRIHLPTTLSTAVRVYALALQGMGVGTPPSRDGKLGTRWALAWMFVKGHQLICERLTMGPTEGSDWNFLSTIESAFRILIPSCVLTLPYHVVGFQQDDPIMNLDSHLLVSGGFSIIENWDDRTQAMLYQARRVVSMCLPYIRYLDGVDDMRTRMPRTLAKCFLWIASHEPIA